MIKPIIQETVDSAILDGITNYVRKDGKKFSDEQVAETVLLFLSIASENTGQALCNTITYLAAHKKWMEEYRKEIEKGSDILASPLIQACIMESVRISTHSAGGLRVPVNKKNIGPYSLHGVDILTVSGILIMKGEDQDNFSDPQTYDPSRFLEPRNESMSSNHLITWSSGIHSCPGRSFAIAELKLSTAAIVSSFDLELVEGLTEGSFFTTTLFNRLNLNAHLKKLLK